MKYFYVVYSFGGKEQFQQGQSSCYYKSNDGNIYPEQLSKRIKESNDFKFVLITNWIEISREVYEKSVGEVKC